MDVIVTVGGGLDPETITPRPANVRVEHYIPQQLVLPRSSLVVSHAGSGTMLGAAAHGIPQLCLPMGADQFLNADVVAEAGCGLSLEPADVTTASVHDAIGRVLDNTTIAAHARSVADEIQQMPDPAALVATVEAHVQRRPGPG